MNNVAVCCVCDRPIEGQVYTLGGRTYDAAHYERVSRENRAAVWPLLVTIGAGVLFAAALALLFHFADIRLTGLGLIVAGVVMAR